MPAELYEDKIDEEDEEAANENSTPNHEDDDKESNDDGDDEPITLKLIFKSVLKVSSKSFN